MWRLLVRIKRETPQPDARACVTRVQAREPPLQVGRAAAERAGDVVEALLVALRGDRLGAAAAAGVFGARRAAAAAAAAGAAAAAVVHGAQRV